jgi:hypothetical protein
LQAPEFSINVGGQYDWTSEIGDVSLRGEVFVSSSLAGSAIIGSYEEPRTFGARLTYEF